MTEKSWPSTIIDFWFDEIGPDGWWSHSPEVDAACAKRFGPLHAAERNKPADAFLENGEQALGAVLLFDQLSRNIFRDTAQAFATDPLARAIADGAIDRGFDADMADAHRQFLYMPFMHSEDVADQERSLQLFGALGDETVLKFAHKHYDMIARFGRFPHRNAVLGRETLRQEKEAVETGENW